MTRILTPLLAIGLLGGLSACANTTSGALIGGSAGAVAGKATGLGTVEGAVVGGAAGAVIGDRNDRRR
ncbi:glycine zipper domain-containing protein [Polymorphobacter sp.]|uniref:glycine zipper domain-containing protein n=1 Tax=Polymorphobacter sp. TaxID=1909290 RepID=UPI003F71A96C